MTQLELRRSVAELERSASERKQAEELLRTAHEQLESRVRERTAELARFTALLEREIEEHKRTEQEVRLLLSITQAISKAPDFHSALGVALSQVCELTGWEFGLTFGARGGQVGLFRHSRLFVLGQLDAGGLELTLRVRELRLGRVHLGLSFGLLALA